MNRLKTLLLTLLLASSALYSASWNVDCNNTTHLNTLHIPQGDCQALEAIWYAFGEGEGWNHTDHWGENNVSAEEWFGVTLQDSGEGIKRLIMYDNTMTGKIPEGIEHFESLETLGFGSVLSGMNNHILGELPLSSIGKIETLRGFSISGCGLSGALPTFVELVNTKIITLYLNDNNFTGPIPQEWSQLPLLENIHLQNNHLSGPFPNLSALTSLTKFRIFHNQFTFADIEPQMGWLKTLDDFYNVSHRGDNDRNYPDPRDHCRDYYMNERNNIVYFDTELSIIPSVVPQNTYSDHDFFSWYKYNIGYGESDVTTDGSRIYIKHNATLENEGYYYYEANNSVVTLPKSYNYGKAHLYYCSSAEQDGIQAIHDTTPTVANLIPTLTATVGEAYTYTSTISDADAADTLTVTASNLPAWLTLSSDQTQFTLSGTPSTAGDYDINLTITDGKIPVHIDYTLHVNADLPTSFTQSGDTYTHTSSGNTIAGSDAFTVVDDGLLLQDSCTQTLGAYLQLESDGTLHTGYQQCSDHNIKHPTLSGVYPAQTHASLQSERIMIELTLTADHPSITLGGN